MRILVVEDEPLILKRIERMVRALLGERLEWLRTASTFPAAEAVLQEHVCDVLLLDLNLEGEDGMTLLHQAVAGSFHTVIISANSDRALEAFAYGVLDFVPKPFTEERLAQALQRVTDLQSRRDYAAQFLAVRKQGRIELVKIDDILFARGAGAYSELALTDGRTELHDKNLEKLQAVLPPVFERVHKSYLVRMTAVAALYAEEGGHHELALKNGQRLPIGRTRYKLIKQRLA